MNAQEVNSMGFIESIAVLTKYATLSLEQHQCATLAQWSCPSRDGLFSGVILVHRQSERDFPNRLRIWC